METSGHKRPVNYLERTGARVGDGPVRVIEHPEAASAALAGAGISIEAPVVEVPPVDGAQ